MERMDGEVSNNARTALLKAQTAMKTREPTSLRAVQLKNNPSGGAGGDENCAIEGLKTTFGEHVTLPVCPAAAGGAPRG